MTTKSERTSTSVLHGMIVERQRLLIREANYLRGLVGLPPVRAEKVGRPEPAATNTPFETSSSARRASTRYLGTWTTGTGVGCDRE
jgi:hypothetical protein